MIIGNKIIEDEVNCITYIHSKVNLSEHVNTRDANFKETLNDIAPFLISVRLAMFVLIMLIILAMIIGVRNLASIIVIIIGSMFLYVMVSCSLELEKMYPPDKRTVITRASSDFR